MVWNNIECLYQYMGENIAMLYCNCHGTSITKLVTGYRTHSIQFNFV